MHIRALAMRVALSVGLLGACTSAREDAARSDQERLLESVLVKGSDQANSLRFDDEEARCAASRIVRDLGTRRLQELGLDVPSRRGPDLTVPPLTAVEGHQVFAAFAGCLDLVAQLAGPFARDADLSTSAARCVARAYVDSGMLEAAILAPSFDEALNERIDRVVTDAIASCGPS